MCLARKVLSDFKSRSVSTGTSVLSVQVSRSVFKPGSGTVLVYVRFRLRGRKCIPHSRSPLYSHTTFKFLADTRVRRQHACAHIGRQLQQIGDHRPELLIVIRRQNETGQSRASLYTSWRAFTSAVEFEQKARSPPFSELMDRRHRLR